MAISESKELLDSDVQTVWNTVTDLQKYQWRSDIVKIEVVSEKQFIEYTKDGYATTFTITVCQPLQRWEFDMDNSNMYGHWTGVFSLREEGTEVIFTEDVTAKKWFMKPFVKSFLKRQQAQYIADLKKALGK